MESITFYRSSMNTIMKEGLRINTQSSPSYCLVVCERSSEHPWRALHITITIKSPPDV